MKENSVGIDAFLAPNAELEVQKAVVESLAADKAEHEETIKAKDAELSAKDGVIAEKDAEIARLKAEVYSLQTMVESEKAAKSALQGQLAARLAKEIDLQERNPNALALLDRDVETPDRFPGETRDHVLEVIAEARERAEAEGRVRKSQLLESVLVNNEPNGTLVNRRRELEKIFADSNNVITGEVIEALAARGISHRKGDEYLLPSEIIKRNY